LKNIRNRIIATLIAFITGFVMFSMANANTPAENKAQGEKFLADNAKNAGITTTASGLQYQVLTEGSGASPAASDNVTVHYKGTTIDGKEFDSSYSRGAPATFPLNRVIAGWTEGVQLMKEGAKYRFFIPSNLAYGERGAGRDIGPNAALIFDVELIKVN
jgi:FKBP-type peptidyl-prolyl cis-trans isomerase